MIRSSMKEFGNKATCIVWTANVALISKDPAHFQCLEPTTQSKQECFKFRFIASKHIKTIYWQRDSTHTTTYVGKRYVLLNKIQERSFYRPTHYCMYFMKLLLLDFFTIWLHLGEKAARIPHSIGLKASGIYHHLPG